MSIYDKFSERSFRLDGKVAVVTGANMGLGVAYATALAKMGADIFIPHYTGDVAEVEELIEKEGRGVAFLQGDLSDAGYRDRIVDRCLEVYGRLDILINNAGTNKFAPPQEFKDEDFARVVEVNLMSYYYLGHKAALQMIRQGGGKIINVGSVLSFTADSNCPSYIVAKHGITGLTRSFANDLGKYNIQCNGIAPGFFATEVNAPLRADPGFGAKITNRIAAGHWGEVSDLMGLAVFLASPASDYMNGVMIPIDGGFLCTL